MGASLCGAGLRLSPGSPQVLGGGRTLQTLAGGWLVELRSVLAMARLGLAWLLSFYGLIWLDLAWLWLDFIWLDLGGFGLAWLWLDLA